MLGISADGAATLNICECEYDVYYVYDYDTSSIVEVTNEDIR